MAGRRGSQGRGSGADHPLPWPKLAAGEPPGPVYGLFGEEDFLVNQAVEAFSALPAFGDNQSLNLERFHAADARPVRILESARTLPFLGSRRLIIALDAHLYKAAQLAEFVDYLKDPVPSTCLLFAGAKLDARLKFAKALKAAGPVHIYKKMYPRQLAPWLAGRAALRGKRLDPRAAEQLAELAGLGLGALDSELEKLALYAGEAEVITLEHVRQATGRGRLYSIFDFTDALAAGRLERALTAYDQLAALGEPPVRVLAMVARLFRQVSEVRGLLDQGGGEGDVQRVLRIPPTAARTVTQRARRESSRGLVGRLERILDADAALKSSAASDRVTMERLIMDLCR